MTLFNKKDKLFIKRTFDLALLGNQKASPNPTVGAVIVHNGKIIGEGYHEQYGGPHAEVNAANSVPDSKKHLLKESTIYISLEPCCIHGNTPPCTDLIIKHKIPKVFVSSIDETVGVQGKSPTLLANEGIEVHTGILQKEGNEICKIRNTFVSQQRPYIILKYAQSEDHFIGKPDAAIWLTNPISKRLVHKWRSEVDAIIIGTNTAKIDNPKLTNRHYYGNSPLRIILDRNLQLPSELNVMDDRHPTLIITQQAPPDHSNKNTQYLQLPFDEYLLERLMNYLYQFKISSLLVEGGAKLLESFIETELWDEARIFTAPRTLGDGIKAPSIKAPLIQEKAILKDKLSIYQRI